MAQSFRSCFAVLATALLVVVPVSSAFQSPLSDLAIREAYFLGQRHDGSFLKPYVKSLPPPKTGPYISSITFLTPFAQLVQFCSTVVGNYSAQQAELDHRNQEEFVRVQVQIKLTDTYSATLDVPEGARRGSSRVPVARPADFWKDFQVQIFDGKRLIVPSGSHGRANWSCGRRGGPCVLNGATVELDVPADAFASDSATIEVNPPEGDRVAVEFYLSSAR